MAAALAGQIALPPAALTAAAPPEPAAVPFPVVTVPEPPQRSYRAAWVSLAAGAGLVAGSFLIHEEANRSYRDYLASTDPARLGPLYDRAISLDRWSAAALIGGEVLLATGVYLRFLRGPAPDRLAIRAGAGGVVVQWRF